MKYLKKFFAVLFGCSLLCGCINDEEEDFYEIKVGDTLPTFTVTMSTGEVVKSQNLKGCVSVIVFFNTDCPDCREGLPVVQQVYDEYRKKEENVRFLCISRNQDNASIAKYWQEHGLTLPYSAQTDKSVYSLFASSIIPRVYIVSKSLIICNSFSDNPIASYNDIHSAISSRIAI